MFHQENMTNQLKTALSRVRRSPYQAVAAILIMTMTLFLASVFTLVAVGSDVVLKFFETRPQINAYFVQDYVPPAQEISRITAQLESTGLTEEIKYISKEEALRIYKQYNQSDPLLLEAVTPQMLPASLEISTTDPNDLKKISDLLKKEPQIKEVYFAEDIVSNLTKWTKSLRVIGVSLVGVHILITFIIILLIIGIKVATRRDEISLLQLVGASQWYVVSPFVWEGIIYGVIGAICAWIASYTLLLYATPFLVSFLSGIPLLPVPVSFMLELLFAEILMGIFVGGLGGLFAARRYLKS